MSADFTFSFDGFIVPVTSKIQTLQVLLHLRDDTKRKTAKNSCSKNGLFFLQMGQQITHR